MVATQGLTAGSDTATTAMMIIMIKVVEPAQLADPKVEPTLLVDDLASQMDGPDVHVVREYGGIQSRNGQAGHAHAERAL